MTTDLRADPAGFPLLWIEPLSAYLHWVPVTKIGFEHFLCAEPDSRFDESWYQAICEFNPRISPRLARVGNYWGTLLSAITPPEAESFARWCGEGYRLPTLEEWMTAYRWLKARPPMDDLSPLTVGRSERVRTLLQQLDTASTQAIREVGYTRTRADQMLLRMGVFEWVRCDDARGIWGAIGEPPPGFDPGLSTPDNGQAKRPVNPETNRIKNYGFRLIWSGD